MPKKKSSQELSPQESAVIESYLLRTYAGPVDFSRHFVVSGPSTRFRKPITKKNGDVFTLKNGTVYRQPKMAEQPEPLTAIAEGEGIFVVERIEEDSIVHLALIRITDFASLTAAA